jgi:hypothetical protein
MQSQAPFQFYGTDHLTAILLTITLPFVLAAFVWRTKSPRWNAGLPGR